MYATAKDINDMNPHLYPGSMAAQGMIYESLIEKTESGFAPLLAESWEVSDDGLAYTFHLRQGVTFHDGAPFNAEAVKKNIDAVQANAERHAWIKLSAKLKQVTVLDEHTVRLELSEPYAPTLLELSMTRPYVFLSPNDFKDGGTKDGVQGHDGTGPYRLAEQKQDQYAVFEANEDYWAGAPAVKRITAKVLPTGETTLLALQKGEVNFLFTDDRGADSLDVEAMQSLVDTGKYQLLRSKPMNTKLIAANSSRADSPVGERAVREALWHAVDRDTIAGTLLHGTETPAEALFSPNTPYADLDLPKRAYDLKRAAELLEEAGWKQGDGGIRTKAGKPLALQLVYDAASLSQKTEAELIQSAGASIGMKLELVGEPSPSLAARRASGDYDLLFNQTWGLAYDPQSTIASFTAESSYRHTTSGIERAEELYAEIEEAARTTDEAARKQLYRDILKTVHDEAVFIPISHGGVTVVAPSDLDGVAFKQTQFELPFEQMKFR
ncbi:Nickel ABC transporter, periplasmic nickel-binding protein NikA [Paenibacillus pasadenensis]|uniref:Nickel ABC transporter, periplasmic nickel-binding protein NikA n=1 Tax=Paenibacillus pasadenensis TaxID=217090 RepID=A0A2N5NB80_9BACL|nr:Nickel ABC transporter, periplasmic nickel-binding protein NikA [Paenibacillus pasadenensis]